MLGSSNKVQEEDQVFYSQAYFRDLCLNTKIHVSELTEINFPKGWVSIVEQFIEQMKTYSIVIISVTDVYSVLDIHFDASKTNKEVLVWRAANKARNLSKGVCANCGESKGLRQKGRTSMFCENCAKNTYNTNKTGTWLDKF